MQVNNNNNNNNDLLGYDCRPLNNNNNNNHSFLVLYWTLTFILSYIVFICGAVDINVSVINR
jgi:hypothetical protein